MIGDYKVLTRKLLLIPLCIIVLVLFLYSQNNFISISRIDFDSEKLPNNFDGMKILHLSDLHNKVFPQNQKSLIRKIKKINPDIIVFTGDLIDKLKYDENAAFTFIDMISEIAPVYYVTGNHESCSGKFSILESKLKSSGIHVLRNENTIINRNGDNIVIAGIDDPNFSKIKDYDYSKIFDSNIRNSLINVPENTFKILLSHHPEMFALYSKYNFDVIFSGHAHGGQFRIPFIGGLYAPGQGYFPEYSSGKYSLNESFMIVSRGLGNSVIPQRIFNRPEIVVLTLHKK
jgi:predicted MPP superfamily phosphohydrolase